MSSRKRKRSGSHGAVSAASSSDDDEDDDGDQQAPSSKRVCLPRTAQRREQEETLLLCVICRTRSRFPFWFPCLQHFACHACILQMVQQYTTITTTTTSATRNGDNETTGALRVVLGTHKRLECPTCRDASPAFDADLTCIFPLSAQLIDFFYGSEAVMTCPYGCDLRPSSAAAICKHLEDKACSCMVLRCSLCQSAGIPYAGGASLQENAAAHIKTLCGGLVCDRDPRCRGRWVGDFRSLSLHNALHDHIEGARTLLEIASHALAAFDLSGSRPAGAPGGGWTNAELPDVTSNVARVFQRWQRHWQCDVTAVVTALSRAARLPPVEYLLLPCNRGASGLAQLWDTQRRQLRVSSEALALLQVASRLDEHEEEEEEHDDVHPDQPGGEEGQAAAAAVD